MQGADVILECSICAVIIYLLSWLLVEAGFILLYDNSICISHQTVLLYYKGYIDRIRVN